MEQPRSTDPMAQIKDHPMSSLMAMRGQSSSSITCKVFRADLNSDANGMPFCSGALAAPQSVLNRRRSSQGPSPRSSSHESDRGSRESVASKSAKSSSDKTNESSPKRPVLSGLSSEQPASGDLGELRSRRFQRSTNRPNFAIGSPQRMEPQDVERMQRGAQTSRERMQRDLRSIYDPY